MSIKISAFNPVSWSNPRQMWQNYLAVQYAFGVESLEIIHDPEDFWCPGTHEIVSIEEGGTPLAEFDHPENVMYVTGNSKFRIPSEHLLVDELVSIEMPVPEMAPIENGAIDDGYTMYGHQALAIVLYDRMRKEHG